MKKLRVLDLFSGIGGFSLGLERTGGFETVAFCEIEDFPRRVLRKHWPEVPIYDDVRTADFSNVGPVDVVAAGFPCQDISVAGRGSGISGERSGLFWCVLRAIRVVGRARLLLENVAALLDRGMGDVLGALASIGYDAEWHCIQACDAGLPHKRDRVFIASHPHGLRELQPGWGLEDFRRRSVHGVQEALRALPDSGRGRADNGFSARVHSLGNAIAPPCVAPMARAILAAEANP